jgi:hypothetical protein
MRIYWAVIVVGVLAVLVAGPLLASSITLTGPGALALNVMATAPIMKTPAGAGVRGEIVVMPAAALDQGYTATFYVDKTARLASSYARPHLRVDTSALRDGLHEIRVEVTDGTRLVMSTGAIPLHVMNDVATAGLQQAPAVSVGFNKAYRKLLLREIVWFDEREADLEKHAFRHDGQLYITLTDLMRHIGGNIIWGPDASYILVERGGVSVRVTAGTAKVLVNGLAESLGTEALRIDNRTFVPVRSMLALFGVSSQWNANQGRLYVEVNAR